MKPTLELHFENRFFNELPADHDASNQRRQVEHACYSLATPTSVSGPKLIAYSKDMAKSLDMSEEDCQSEAFLQAFSGNQLLEGMQSYAMCYGGHQFGNWAGQLGDGRAINLGEVNNAQGEHWALQLKGAGPTPYSRTADGLAVLRSSVREFVCSEAMYHLGVPTTRALSLMTTGEQVMRDMLYDGNADLEPGAVVCRVAPSFIRFGNFQIFWSRQQHDELRQLANFTIRHHFPHLLVKHQADSPELYIAWFREVCELTVTMIVHWMRVGFVHGVMNTDNMSILGLTIDYGPYGWLDNFDPNWTPNTTDAGERRYRYAQQPQIALWNLYQLANSLYPLIEQTAPLEAALADCQASYEQQWQQMMASKLGLLNYQASDQLLIDSLQNLMAEQETDMTLFYRLLAEVSEESTMTLFADAFYQPDSHSADYQRRFGRWLKQYQQRITQDGLSNKQRKTAMNQVNPKYLFRNYLAQQAIDQAEQGNNEKLHELLNILRFPYDEQLEHRHYAQKRPDWARTKVGCSMLSCSS